MTALLVALQLSSQVLHPAFLKDEGQILAAWEQGQRDAPNNRNPEGAWKRAARGIGRIRTGVIGESTVSWAYYLSPELVAYTHGFMAKKRYWDAAETDTALNSLRSIAKSPPLTMAIHVTISLQPSFGYGGRIVSMPNPKEIEDVRCVLMVGDRIYQPLSKPGDLTASRTSLTNEYRTGEWSSSRTRLFLNGSYAGTAESESAFAVRRVEDYNVFDASFTSFFALYDPDGTPRISKNAKDFTVIVVYGSNERKATWQLDWVANPLGTSRS